MTSRPLARPRLEAVPQSAVPALSDAELIAAVVQGDAEVAGQVHDRLVGVIDQTLFRVLGQRVRDHDDLMQSAFEQVVRSLLRRQFVGACSLRTWASRITTHVALNWIRSRRRERNVIVRFFDFVDVHVADARSERRPEAALELGRLQRHLSAMRESHSEVLVLHDVHGHDLHEIARLLEITSAAAQSRLVRARAELRRRLDHDPPSPASPGGTP